MPELPEVEVVRRGLAAHTEGRQIASAEVMHPRVGRRQAGGGAEIEARLAGRTVERARRRGKYLWLELDDAQYLLVHLGMSGQMLIKSESSAVHKHLRARLELDDGTSVWFVDQRTFGAWEVGDLATDGIPPSIAHIGRDLFDPDFDLDDAIGKIRRKRSDIKRVLLDQTVVSGIGNIYADEMLWLSSVHPLTPASALSEPKVAALLDAGREVMSSSLDQGGTSFDELYVNVNGESGYFSRSLNAYGQQGTPCSRCGTLIVREQFMNRGSHYCPECQQLG